MKTHYDECWRDHLECAIAHIERLQAENDRLQVHVDSLITEVHRLLKALYIIDQELVSTLDVMRCIKAVDAVSDIIRAYKDNIEFTASDA